MIFFAVAFSFAAEFIANEFIFRSHANEAYIQTSFLYACLAMFIVMVAFKTKEKQEKLILLLLWFMAALTSALMLVAISNYQAFEFISFSEYFNFQLIYRAIELLALLWTVKNVISSYIWKFYTFCIRIGRGFNLLGA